MAAWRRCLADAGRQHVAHEHFTDLLGATAGRSASDWPSAKSTKSLRSALHGSFFSASVARFPWVASLARASSCGRSCAACAVNQRVTASRKDFFESRVSSGTVNSPGTRARPTKKPEREFVRYRSTVGDVTYYGSPLGTLQGRHGWLESSIVSTPVRAVSIRFLRRGRAFWGGGPGS